MYGVTHVRQPLAGEQVVVHRRSGSGRCQSPRADTRLRKHDGPSPRPCMPPANTAWNIARKMRGMLTSWAARRAPQAIKTERDDVYRDLGRDRDRPVERSAVPIGKASCRPLPAPRRSARALSAAGHGGPRTDRPNQVLHLFAYSSNERISTSRCCVPVGAIRALIAYSRAAETRLASFVKAAAGVSML
jgi:hypothetical protein